MFRIRAPQRAPETATFLREDRSGDGSPKYARDRAKNDCRAKFNGESFRVEPRRRGIPPRDTERNLDSADSHEADPAAAQITECHVLYPSLVGHAWPGLARGAPREAPRGRLDCYASLVTENVPCLLRRAYVENVNAFRSRLHMHPWNLHSHSVARDVGHETVTQNKSQNFL